MTIHTSRVAFGVPQKNWSWHIRNPHKLQDRCLKSLSNPLHWSGFFNQKLNGVHIIGIKIPSMFFFCFDHKLYTVIVKNNYSIKLNFQPDSLSYKSSLAAFYKKCILAATIKNNFPFRPVNKGKFTGIQKRLFFNDCSFLRPVIVQFSNQGFHNFSIKSTASKALYLPYPIIPLGEFIHYMFSCCLHIQ